MEQSHPHRLIQPLNCSCDPSVSEPSLCTATGRRYKLLSYVDLGNGNHYSQSLLCHLRSEVLAPSFVSIVNPSDPRLFPPTVLGLIPTPVSFCTQQPPSIRPMRYRNKMRSRWGGSRGGATRPGYRLPSVSSSPSVSPSPTLSNPLSLGRYLNTRSGRGRLSTSEACHSGGIPQHAATNATSQQAHFHFQSALNKPLIMVTITVDFREVPASNSEPTLSREFNQDPPFSFVPREPSSRSQPKDKDITSSSKQQMLGSEATHKDKGIQIEDSVSGGHAENTGFEDYGWCPIVEEEPTKDTMQMLSRSRGEP